MTLIAIFLSIGLAVATITFLICKNLAKIEKDTDANSKW